MLKFKKIVSLLLAVLMVMSAFTVMTTAAGAVTYEDTKLYFDLSSTGWELGAKDKVGFYVFSAEYGELLPWGGKKLNGTDEGDGIWSYDPAAKGMDIKEGEQYKIIFTGAGNQTYDLIFDTTCYGHVAYCDDTIYENPVDSSKQTRAAFWKDMDATKYGPVLQISSIGTVVGTCPEEGKTPLTIFEDFLTNTLANARTYMVDTGKKTEQQLIDDIGEGLGLTKDDVAASIASTDTESTWSADASALPAAEKPTEPAPVLDNTKLYFDVSTTGWDMGAKDKVGFYIHSVAEGEELPWGGKKLNGVDEGDGIWSYEPNAKGMTINEGVQYQVIFTGAGQQTADLFFDTTCFGHVAYCNGEMIENTVDSSKKNQVALWKDLDPADYGPVKGITSLGNLVGTCLPQGETDESLFTAWLTDTGATGYANAMKYTVEPGTKTEQQLIDDLAGALELTKDFVEQAIAESGIESAWTADASSLPADETPTEPETQAHTHTPGEAVQENVVPATCKAEGSYDEVVYCTECGEELSREAKTIDKLAHTPGAAVYENEVITHDYIKRDSVTYCTECGEELSRQPVQLPILTHSLNFVDEVPATYEADGVMAHYECSVCGELFSDEQGRHWVSAAELVIPKLAPTEPAPTEPETQTIETVTPEPGEPTYYIVGGFTDWQMKEEYAMTKIAEGDSVKYLFKDLALASTDQFKVVSYNWSLPDPVQTWYPDGMGNNYGENGEITAEGTYDVYFDPALATDGWFYNCIYVDGMPAPTQPAPTEPETQTIETVAPVPGEPDVYVVGNFTDWQINDEYKMTKIADGKSFKYLFEDLALTTTDQFKVVACFLSLPEPEQKWYPDGMGNNYGENGEITAEGTYDVYFDPVGATDGWFYNCIYVDGMPAHTQPAPTEPGTEPVVVTRAIDSMANVDDLVAEAGITDTFTVYFKMPTSGEHSWANEYNELDGVNRAGIYWWQGSMNLNPWPGAKMTIVDAEQGIFSANVPYESDELTNIIFNNAVDGGTDKTTPQYAAAQQTVNVNCQGYEPGESDTMPEGTSKDNFDGCIFICKPAEVTTSEYSGKETFFGDWYFYYGDGCYGKYAMSSDHFTYVDEMCCNPEHHHDPLIPTEPESKDGYYVVGNFTNWAYKDEFKMTEGEDGIYTLATELTTLSRFKIVHVEGENVTWIPDGIGSDYVDIPDNGTYTVCFDPKFSHSDWYYDCITIELISAADFKLGDVDGDGDITVVDATFIQRYATFVDVPGVSDPKMRIVADVDGDGDVTIVDATFVQRSATMVPVPYKIGEII